MLVSMPGLARRSVVARGDGTDAGDREQLAVCHYVGINCTQLDSLVCRQVPAQCQAESFRQLPVHASGSVPAVH